MKCSCGFRSVSKSTMLSHVRGCSIAKRRIAESHNNSYNITSSDSMLSDMIIMNMFTSSSYSDFSSNDSGYSGGGGDFGGGGSSGSWSDSSSSSSDSGSCGGCD